MDEQLNELKEKQQEIGDKISLLQETNKRKDEEAAEIRQLIIECRENLNRIKSIAPASGNALAPCNDVLMEQFEHQKKRESGDRKSKDEFSSKATPAKQAGEEGYNQEKVLGIEESKPEFPTKSEKIPTKEISPSRSPKGSPRGSPRGGSRETHRGSREFQRGSSREIHRGSSRESRRGSSREAQRDSQRGTPRESHRAIYKESQRDIPDYREIETRDSLKGSFRDSLKGSPTDSAREYSRGSIKETKADESRHTLRERVSERGSSRVTISKSASQKIKETLGTPPGSGPATPKNISRTSLRVKDSKISKEQTRSLKDLEREGMTTPSILPECVHALCMDDKLPGEVMEKPPSIEAHEMEDEKHYHDMDHYGHHKEKKGERVSCKVDLNKMKVRIRGPSRDLKKLDATQLINLLEKFQCQELIIHTGDDVVQDPGEIRLVYLLHPGNIVMVAGIIMIAFLTNANLCNVKRTQKTKFLLNSLYLCSFAFHFGLVLWMTFIRGYALRFGLNHDTFHLVDNLVLPKYFTICVLLSAMSLYSFLATHCACWPMDVMAQMIVVVVTFFMELITICYVIPALIKLRDATDDYYIDEEDQDYVLPQSYERNLAKMEKLNWTICLINLLTIIFLGANVYYITSKLLIE